ncbi:Polyketide cyclase / dehydrase and lipid transport [Palleronia salina]|uniref:Polyketide cyclase / dehydrase and lipid transport n=1 Tax=Palleronia salina TaxID=313368 RepID=A0A1M6LCX1_9RHOB|nr:SRPBCC family protein [Palleronia salina]SHJ69053.1 Polyketide cyclase / dehydrase and lipid transport [Palleronia salina]
MKISTRRDVDVAPDRVFAALTDFTRFEQKARAAGAQVDLTNGESRGMAAWRVRFDYRGRSRKADLRVVTYDPDTQLAIKAELDGIHTLFNVEVMEVAPNCARMFVSLDIRPTTMKGRLLVQSLKLAKTSMTRRLDRRLDQFAREIERRPAGGI